MLLAGREMGPASRTFRTSRQEVKRLGEPRGVITPSPILPEMMYGQEYIYCDVDSVRILDSQHAQF